MSDKSVGDGDRQTSLLSAAVGMENSLDVGNHVAEGSVTRPVLEMTFL